MEKNIKKNIQILIASSVIGIFWSVYLLYSERGGYLAVGDWIALTITSVFVVGLNFYFISKWKKKS